MSTEESAADRGETPPVPERQGYDTDLAFVHHAGYGDWARAAASALLDALHRSGVRRGTVVDLGCGSGILAARMSAAGFDVLGVDRAPAMLALARTTAPAARFVESSVFDVDLPPMVAATAIGEVLNYAFDDRSGLAALEALLHAVRAALLPGGFFLFDVATPGRGGGHPREGFEHGDDWSIQFHVEEDPIHRTLTRRIVTTRRIGGIERRTQEQHVLRLFERDAVLAAVAAAGLRWVPLAGYGDLHLGPGICVGMAYRGNGSGR